MVIILGNGQGKASQVQTLDKAVYISHYTNTLANGMNPTILPQDKRHTMFFNLDMARRKIQNSNLFNST